jgi:hypothetical protein
VKGCFEAVPFRLQVPLPLPSIASVQPQRRHASLSCAPLRSGLPLRGEGRADQTKPCPDARRCSRPIWWAVGLPFGKIMESKTYGDRACRYFVRRSIFNCHGSGQALDSGPGGGQTRLPSWSVGPLFDDVDPIVFHRQRFIMHCLCPRPIGCAGFSRPY